MSATSRLSMDGIKLRDLTLAAACSLGASTACLCPPCAAPGATTAAATPAAEAAPAAAGGGGPVASGTQTMIWDGEEAAAGMSWASCDKEGKCKATLAIAQGEGANGTNALKLHGEGEGWQGGGWNWHGWWPENAGTDISGFDNLTLSVKVAGASKEKTPQATGINFTFGCSKDKKNSADANLGKYAATAADGQWHEVTIPLKDFFDGKGAECDARTAWEIRVSSWAGTEMNYDILLDNIAVKKK
jgi:hypothetical protein